MSTKQEVAEQLEKQCLAQIAAAEARKAWADLAHERIEKESPFIRASKRETDLAEQYNSLDHDKNCEAAALGKLILECPAAIAVIAGWKS